MRYRAEYLHVPTSSRIIFTVPIPLDYEGQYVGSAGEAMAKRAAMKWIEETGLTNCVMLGVVNVTDKMSVGMP